MNTPVECTFAGRASTVAVLASLLLGLLPSPGMARTGQTSLVDMDATDPVASSVSGPANRNAAVPHGNPLDCSANGQGLNPVGLVSCRKGAGPLGLPGPSSGLDNMARRPALDAAETAQGPCLSIPLLDDKCESWVATYNNPSHGAEALRSIAVSPTGDRVFVTGVSWDDEANRYDIATVAFDSDTGEQAWVSRYDGPAGLDEYGYSVDVDPTGMQVFVTGLRDWNSRVADIHGGGEVVTIAYDAATGRELWVAAYDGPWPEQAVKDGIDWGYRVKVSPDGARVFVAGSSAGGLAANPFGLSLTYDYVTIAYDAATGKELWSARYGAYASDERAWDLGVSPDGAQVFVTGDAQADFVTVAYDSGLADNDENQEGGRQLWASRYDGGGPELAYSLGVNPDGTLVYVTGTSRNGSDPLGSPNYDYATVAYGAGTGEPVWVSLYDGSGTDFAYSLAVDPAGRHVYVTGRTSQLPNPVGEQRIRLCCSDGTVAYDAKTGEQVWDSVSNLATDVYPLSVVVSHDGERVYVAGISINRAYVFPLSTDFVTIAYVAGSGVREWTARFNSSSLPGLGSDYGLAVAVSPRSDRVFTGGIFAEHQVVSLAGLATGTPNENDFGLVSYEVAASTHDLVPVVTSGE